MCGHLAHGQYLEASAWAIEAALYGGLLVAAVVGLLIRHLGAPAVALGVSTLAMAHMLHVASRVVETLVQPVAAGALEPSC